MKRNGQETSCPLLLVMGWFFVLPLSCPAFPLRRAQGNRKGLIIMSAESCQSRFLYSRKEAPSGDIPLPAFSRLTSFNASTLSVLLKTPRDVCSGIWYYSFLSKRGGERDNVSWHLLLSTNCSISWPFYKGAKVWHLEDLAPSSVLHCSLT